MAKKASLGQVGQSRKAKVAEELSKVIQKGKSPKKEKAKTGSTAISLRLPAGLLEELDTFLEEECHGLGRSAFIKQAIVEKMKSMI